MKKWWILLAAIAFILLAWGTGTSRLNAHEFSFLDRYHPQIKMMEVKSAGYPERRYYYFFDRENSAKVLPAMERELVSSKGYVRKEYGGPGNVVSFVRSSGGRDTWASYHSPEHPVTFSTHGESFGTLPGGCSVWINREPTWLERQIDAFKRIF